MEIGIHRGKSFIPFKKVFANQFSIYIACDVFGDQEKNLDGSGSGDREIFESNLQKHATTDRVLILEQDSLDITSQQIAKHGLLRFASIDGGHTFKHTLNDLKIFSQALAPMGIIMVDDVFNAPWCEVSWALGEFLRGQNDVKAFAIGVNKVFLCKMKEHETLCSAAQDSMTKQLSFSIKSYWGSKVVVYQPIPLKRRMRERAKNDLQALSPALYGFCIRAKNTVRAFKGKLR